MIVVISDPAFTAEAIRGAHSVIAALGPNFTTHTTTPQTSGASTR